jgi:hypothetical protein
MEPPEGHVAIGEAGRLCGYSPTALRKAFDAEPQQIHGVRIVRRGKNVRYFERESLLEWARQQPQGAKKLARAAAQSNVDASANVGEADPRAKPPGDPTPHEEDAVTRPTYDELLERIEELQTENEGQAAAYEQLFDTLVQEAKSRYEQLTRLAQAHKTTEAAHPGRRKVSDLTRELADLNGPLPTEPPG